MYIYRVMNQQRFFEGKITNSAPLKKNVNTFEYDGDEYVHFFILPEQAEMYKNMYYDCRGLKSIILKCDVPVSLLKSNFGIGMYRCEEDTMMVPFLEVRLNKKEFHRDMIEGISSEVIYRWLDEDVYYQYTKDISNMGGDRYPIAIDITKNVINQTEEEPKINPNFNFFEYFPRQDLESAGLWTKSKETYNNSRIKSFSKKLKEKIQCLFDKNKRR